MMSDGWWVCVDHVSVEWWSDDACACAAVLPAACHTPRRCHSILLPPATRVPVVTRSYTCLHTPASARATHTFYLRRTLACRAAAYIACIKVFFATCATCRLSARMTTILVEVSSLPRLLTPLPHSSVVPACLPHAHTHTHAGVGVFIRWVILMYINMKIY